MLSGIFMRLGESLARRPLSIHGRRGGEGARAAQIWENFESFASNSGARTHIHKQLDAAHERDLRRNFVL